MPSLSIFSSFLFDTFPREVGNPFRRIVHREKEFLQFIEQNDGRGPVFVNIYGLEKEVDKLFYDFDEPFAFEFVSKFAKWLYYNNIAFIPIITGRKGYHIYVLVYPEKLIGTEGEQKQQLADAQLWLIEQAICYYPIVVREYDLTKKIKTYYHEKKKIDPSLFHLFTKDSIHWARFFKGKIQTYVRIYNHENTKEEWWFTPACDVRLIGDINRFGRVPNTRRVFGDITNYCTYLPLTFFNKSEYEVLKYQKAPQVHTVPRGATKEIKEFIQPLEVEFNNAIMLNMETEEALAEYIPDSPLLKIIHELVNPGVFRANLSPEPPQEARFALIAELKGHGLSKNETMEVCRALFHSGSWTDFKEGKCHTQVKQIYRKNYQKMGKKTLLSLGLATEKDFDRIHDRAGYWKFKG
jgi:hypothetical protein